MNTPTTEPVNQALNAGAERVLTMREPTQLLDDKLAAPFLGYKAETLKNSRHTGKLAGVDGPRFIKMGRSVRYCMEDLMAWREQFEVKTCTRDGVCS